MIKKIRLLTLEQRKERKKRAPNRALSERVSVWSVERISLSVETVDKKIGMWVLFLRTCFVIENPDVCCVGPYYVLPFLNAAAAQ